jgi:predicted RecB family nuclease
LIYRARAHDAGTPLLRVESTALACPRADVEVDIDMESYDGLTYLWGATITSHIPGITSGHHIEVTWAPLDADEEAALFARWWQWWMALRAQCETLGASLAGYCFWAAAENEAMRRAARDQISEVNTFLASPAWVDMHDVTARLIQTDGPTGLKQLAQAAGFTWRDENPSGEASMLWYEQAVAVGEHDAWRTRVLEYNEDDCRATRALRDWLVGPARNLPHRDDPRWSTT